MTLIDEREVYYEQERKRKLFKNIIKAIIVLVVIAIVLLIFMKVKNYGKMTLVIDGKNVSNIPNTLLLKDDSGKIYNNDGKIYLCVNDVSNLLNTNPASLVVILFLTNEPDIPSISPLSLNLSDVNLYI